jgi:hypothetical protein
MFEPQAVKVGPAAGGRNLRSTIADGANALGPVVVDGAEPLLLSPAASLLYWRVEPGGVRKEHNRSLAGSSAECGHDR